MTYITSLIGDGTSNSPLRPAAPDWESWENNGDGTATVTLTTAIFLQVRSFAASAADALNGGSTWDDLTSIKPDSLPLTLVKQDLTNIVKKKFSEFDPDPVPQGFVVSHDNGTTKGLWRATMDTTAEPTKDHADWSFIFEVTI